MRKFYKILLAILVVGISFTASAQQKYWSLSGAKSGIATDKAVARPSFPTEFKLFDLDINPLRQQLLAVTGNQASRHSTIISLPDADGNIEEFEVFEASNFDPALQARFPEIRAFSGQGVTDKAATLKLSISPQGIQTMVFRTEKDNEFIEAYSQDHTVYAVFKSRRTQGQLPWTCSTDDKMVAVDLSAQLPSVLRTESSTGQLKVMRLAQSVTGEYSNYFGATSAAQVGLVLAAINATLTRCNGCYEKDLAIHLNLIPTTTDVIFYDGTSDPYSNASIGAGGAWNGQLQSTLTSIIGDANYDIGHLFGASGGGGNAGCIGCVCGSGKGSGFTSPADAIPQGDNFDIDYVVHEVGHQLGANHTFSMSNEGSGVNKEVGSGITIMGYAGITNQDVAPHSIDIYHEASIQQIQINMAGKTCPVTTVITANNATPVVASVSNYTIPRSTPFALTGSATDANATDVLTYCWEQNDQTTTSGSSSVASPTKFTGPNWLSFSPTTSPTRLFPKLSTILAGLSVTPPLPGGDGGANIEALSSVGRTLNFRLTVRDNALYSSTAPVKVGQTAFTDMAVTVDGTSGPFLLTSQNTAVSYQAGSSQTITWSVNGTTSAPINCNSVNILLSSDGGVTFPTLLAYHTANDGTETVSLPAPVSTSCRIKIEAVNNIFFDISNSNFSNAVVTPTYDYNNPAAVTAPCGTLPTLSATLGVVSFAGFNTPVTLSVLDGTPAGSTVTFGTNPVTPGGSSSVILSNTNTLSAGTYDIIVSGTAGGITLLKKLTFTILPGVGPVINDQPLSIPVCLGSDASFTVAAPGAISYLWQVSTDGGDSYVTAPGVSNGTTYTATGVVQTQNNYRYRVIVNGPCASTTSSDAILTINPPPVVTTQPESTTLCVTSDASFTAAGTGGTLGYLWQVSTDGGTVYNAAPGINNGANYTVPAITTAMNNNRYRVIISGTCSPSATSNGALLTVISPVVVTDQPDDITICETGTVNFAVAGTSSVTVLYQWEDSTSAHTWQAINGQTGASLTVANVAASMNGNGYRAKLSNATCTVPTISAKAVLTVNARPTVTIAAPLTTLLPGQSSTIAATINPAPTGFNITWYKNTSVLPGITGTSYLVDSVEIGDYQVKIVNAVTGCNNESNVLTIGTAASERLFVFPSPTTGQFTLSYYNASGSSTQRVITIYDSRGMQVYNAKLSINGPYTLLNINLTGSSRGIYIISVGDASGKKLTKGKVVIN